MSPAGLPCLIKVGEDAPTPDETRCARVGWHQHGHLPFSKEKVRGNGRNDDRVGQGGDEGGGL